jgi:hypothetical protein
MPVRASPIAPLGTAKASLMDGTTGLMTSRAAIVAKKARVHVPRTAPWRDQRVTGVETLVREEEQSRRAGAGVED